MYDQIHQDLSQVSVSDASISAGYLAISTFVGTQFQIHSFRIDVATLALEYVQTAEVQGEVTCLAVGPNFAVLAGIWKDGRPLLSAYFPHTIQTPGVIDLSYCMCLEPDFPTS
jgi:hypothetical protein